MRQGQLFTTAHLASMRDRTKRRNYSPEAEQFRREQDERRSWGLQQRHARTLCHLYGSTANAAAAYQRRVDEALSTPAEPTETLTSTPAPATPAPATPAAAVPAAADAVMSGPIAAEPGKGGLAGSEPVMPDSVTAEPVTAEPVTAEPVTAEPVTAEPVTAEPVTAGPAPSGPVAAAPVMPDSATIEPVTAEHAVSEPVLSEPVLSRVALGEPVMSGSLVSKPVAGVAVSGSGPDGSMVSPDVSGELEPAGNHRPGPGAPALPGAAGQVPLRPAGQVPLRPAGKMTPGGKTSLRSAGKRRPCQGRGPPGRTGRKPVWRIRAGKALAAGAVLPRNSHGTAGDRGWCAGVPGERGSKGGLPSGRLSRWAVLTVVSVAARGISRNGLTGQHGFSQGLFETPIAGLPRRPSPRVLPDTNLCPQHG
jgi:hypothetical protein